MSDSTLVPARPAATVIVLRPGAVDEAFEVLMVRRNDRVAFMGGAYVFPGGRVDATDIASPPEACDGFDTISRCEDLTRAEEAQYRVAAIRELLEEAGVLLAHRDGAMADAATTAAVRASHQGTEPFVAHVAGYSLRVALDAVMPFAHWVTPEVEPRRYDTRFLLARVPADQAASHDAGETTALEWLRPADAIARGGRGEMLLPPPTWSTLKRLARFVSIEDAWAWACTTPIVRIQPGSVGAAGVTALTLPGDPTYPLAPGSEPFDDTRFEFVEGVGWRPVQP